MENKTREIRERCLMSIPEASQILGIDERKLYLLEQRKKLTDEHEKVCEDLTPHIIVKNPEEYTIEKFEKLFKQTCISVHRLRELSGASLPLIKEMANEGVVKNRMTLYKSIHALERYKEAQSYSDKLLEVVNETGIPVSVIAKKIGVSRTKITRALKTSCEIEEIDEIFRLVSELNEDQKKVEHHDGKNLKAFREELGLTIYDAVYLFDVGPNVIRSLENQVSFNYLNKKYRKILDEITSKASDYAANKEPTKAIELRESLGMNRSEASKAFKIPIHVISAAEHNLATSEDYERYEKALLSLIPDEEEKESERVPIKLKRTILNEAWI